jgi:hypothetical protein
MLHAIMSHVCHTLAPVSQANRCLPSWAPHVRLQALGQPLHSGSLRLLKSAAAHLRTLACPLT